MLQPNSYRAPRQRMPRERPRSGPVFVSLLLASAALLVLSRLDHSIVRTLRSAISGLVSPPLALAHLLTLPARVVGRNLAGYQELVAEVERLKQADGQLQAAEWRVRELEWRLGQLGSLARVVEATGHPFVSGRVVADARGPFAQALLLDAGRRHGIRPGHPVIGTDGLIGRVVDASDGASRILLLTDPSSRVPVLIGAAGVRALALGDNNQPPRIGFLADSSTLVAGDDVYTSGDGGLFPRGLRLGALVASGADWRVRLQARLAGLDYVSVLLASSPGVEAWQDDVDLPRHRGGRRAAALRAAGAEREAGR